MSDAPPSPHWPLRWPPRLPQLRAQSLRARLLLGILLPVGLLVALNAVSLYRQALGAADTAYDRTLLASAKSIGEQLAVIAAPDGAASAAPRLVATVPYSALEAFEADNRSRMVYRVDGFAGERVSGYDDLPRWRGRVPQQGPYAALVDFYDDRYQGEPVRVAVLLQPVSGLAGQGMATIQVAETLELRRTLARQILIDTLWRQAALLAVIAGVVLWVVQRTTLPVRRLSDQLRTRAEGDLAPIAAAEAPRELQPLLEATNQVMARLAHLLAHQKRFVRDAAHQLRTPLAVLRVQVQSAQRGDMPPAQALTEIAHTTARATQLANQMLALAKVEQLRQQGDAPLSDLAEAVHAVALDLAPLVAERELNFELDIAPDAQPLPVRAHDWALRELTRNLLHNAVRATPEGAPLLVRLQRDAGQALLTIADSGPGIDAALRSRLGQPFTTGHAGRGGSGLGLTIAQEIVQSLGGSLSLDNRPASGSSAADAVDAPAAAIRICGLDAQVRLPLATAD